MATKVKITIILGETVHISWVTVPMMYPENKDGILAGLEGMINWMRGQGIPRPPCIMAEVDGKIMAFLSDKLCLEPQDDREEALCRRHYLKLSNGLETREIKQP